MTNNVSMIVLLCGLSGVGKTTLARKAQSRLTEEGIEAMVIDGDEYRKTICKDLGFSKADRFENIRRLGLIANEFSLKGVVSIISAINPYEEIRKELKTTYENVKTVYLDCSVDVLLARDTKGLYKRALLPAGHPQKIDNLTGINDEFEVPVNLDLYINTSEESVDTSLQRLLFFIMRETGNVQKERRIMIND